jgi:hypothetical protein
VEEGIEKVEEVFGLIGIWIKAMVAVLSSIKDMRDEKLQGHNRGHVSRAC